MTEDVPAQRTRIEGLVGGSPLIDCRAETATTFADEAAYGDELGEDGEVLVRGAVITPGHPRQEQAIRTLVVGDGWVHTGDTGTLDDEVAPRVAQSMGIELIDLADRWQEPQIRVTAHGAVDRADEKYADVLTALYAADT